MTRPHSGSAHALNFPRTDYPRDSSVVALFAEVVRARANSTAVRQGDRALTYAELMAQTTTLVGQLKARGVARGDLVAVCFDRSIEMVCALLATLWCGAAYVPLDPDYPSDRLEFMLSDTSAKVLLTQPHLVQRLPSDPAGTVVLVHPSPDIASSPACASAMDFDVAPTDRAYVMYTSGTTGQPKGVIVPHRAIVRLVRNTNYVDFNTCDRCLQAAPISFDAATLEIWGPLLNGAELVLLAPGRFSLADLGRTIVENEITVLWLTAGLFNAMVDEHLDDLRGVRQLIAGGDVLSKTHVAKALSALPMTTITNGYGPTENTTFTCCHRITPEDTKRASIPIGRPIANTAVYILDDDLCPTPPGEIGELFTGGDGLAQGYWNRPELTSQRFIPDPTASGNHLYRTGDLCRWPQGGPIEFVGRRDSQVKIRGYRIELGEIEAAFTQHAAVRRACVVAQETGSGDKQLVAYIVAQTPQPKDDELLRFVGSKLPAYMTPPVVVFLRELPLDPNGKVDRRALPPARAEISTRSTPGAPATNLERVVTETWQEVLSVQAIGPDDNFFELGGNSLLLARVHDRLQKRLERTFPIVDLFSRTTIRTLSAHLGSSVSSSGPRHSIADRARRQHATLATRQRPH